MALKTPSDTLVAEDQAALLKNTRGTVRKVREPIIEFRSVLNTLATQPGEINLPASA